MKTEITITYSYKSISLIFKKEFDLPFAPFYGLSLTFDNEYSPIILENNEYTYTIIDYNIISNQFDIKINRNWRYPISNEIIDGVLVNFLTWERLDNTNAVALKELMNMKL